MSYGWTVVSWVHTCVFVIMFLIASFGRKLGLRRRYIQLLLKLFTFSEERVDDQRRRIRVASVSLDDSDTIGNDIRKLSFSQPTYLGMDQSGFHMEDILEYVTAGVSAVVEDSVLTNFVPEKPPCWNLLSRNNTRAYELISFRLTMYWMAGFLFRYVFLLPMRMLVLVIGMGFLLVCTIVVGVFPEGAFKRKLNGMLNMFCFDFVAGSLSLVATFHNTENRPCSGIAVANHTSPIDSMILFTDNVYDMVGQIQGGLLGYFMTLLGRTSTHIWFDRSDNKDRASVTRRIREHTQNSDLPPILIFPEGVCVNNLSVVQFKKGAFEVDCVIYPIVIKFDSRYGDAFWSRDTFFNYVVYMMTSWAIVCDVWYLPPVTRRDGETPIAFAARVKATIAAKGGMNNMSIDGFLKLRPPKENLKHLYQLEFAKHCLGENDDVVDGEVGTGVDNDLGKDGIKDLGKDLVKDKKGSDWNECKYCGKSRDKNWRNDENEDDVFLERKGKEADVVPEKYKKTLIEEESIQNVQKIKNIDLEHTEKNNIAHAENIHITDNCRTNTSDAETIVKDALEFTDMEIIKSEIKLTDDTNMVIINKLGDEKSRTNVVDQCSITREYNMKYEIDDDRNKELNVTKLGSLGQSDVAAGTSVTNADVAEATHANETVAETTHPHVAVAHETYPDLAVSHETHIAVPDAIQLAETPPSNVAVTEEMHLGVAIADATPSDVVVVHATHSAAVVVGAIQSDVAATRATQSDITTATTTSENVLKLAKSSVYLQSTSSIKIGENIEGDHKEEGRRRNRHNTESTENGENILEDNQFKNVLTREKVE